MIAVKPPPNSPYKGLVPFSEEDAPFFFGRERESKIITANLKTRRLTLLIGPSGVGKSSVLNAGVAYHLRQRAQQATPQVAAPAGNGSKLGLGSPAALGGLPGPARPAPAVVVFTVWSGDPLGGLREAILKEMGRLGLAPTEAESQRLCSLPLAEMLWELTGAGRGAGAAGTELLIILDQFEEYFVYHPADEGEGGFSDELARAVTSPGLRANFLISIREDWLARLDRFNGRMPNPFDSSIRVDNLDREAARSAIVKPIARYNEFVRRYNGTHGASLPKAAVTDEFATKLLEQIERLDERGEGEDGVEVSPETREARAAALRIHTPHLQIVLSRLWERVQDNPTPTLETELLNDKDTARTIIRSHIHESLEHLTRREKLLAANLFRFLVTPSGTKYASTARWLAGQVGGRNAERLRPLLEKLSERDAIILDRIAPSPGPSTEPRYQLTSDALAKFVLDWSKEVRARQRRRDVMWKRLVIASLVALVVLLVVGILFFWGVRKQQNIAESARHEAERQRELAVQQKEEAQRALEVIKRQNEMLDDLTPYSRAVLRGHMGAITSASFYVGDLVLTASADGSARLWDVEEKESVASWDKGQGPLTRAASNRDGSLIALAGLKGTVFLWNRAAEKLWELRGSGGHVVTDLAFSPAGDLLAAVGGDGTLMVWAVASGSPSGEPKVLTGHTGKIRRVAFNGQGTLLATAGEDATARLWHVADWRSQVLQGHTGAVNDVAFSPDERWIVTAGADKTVRVWSVAAGGGRVLGRHAAGVNTAEFDNLSGRVVTASNDATARVWRLDSLTSVALNGHTNAVFSAAFSPDGKQVVTASKDSTARVWSSSTGVSLAELRGHLGEVTGAVFNAAGRLVLTASTDGTARVWAVPQPGGFEIERPTIEALPAYHVGTCPVTIRFVVKITTAGRGTVLYRFRGSDERIWPIRRLDFEEPGSKYVNWYWKLEDDYTGSESIEIIDPPGIEPQKAKFTVKCTEGETGTQVPSPSAQPSP